VTKDISSQLKDKVTFINLIWTSYQLKMYLFS